MSATNEKMASGGRRMCRRRENMEYLKQLRKEKTIIIIIPNRTRVDCTYIVNETHDERKITQIYDSDNSVERIK